MDMAKELSMLENNAKGKETRKYFIAVEKEYKLQNSNEISGLAPMFMEFMNAQQKQNEMMMESMRLLTALVTDMRNTQATQTTHLLQKQVRVNTTITAKQMDKLNSAIRNAAVHVAKFHKLTTVTATRVIYGELNGRMGVSTYYQILEKDFLRAMIFVKTAGEKAKLENENINQLLEDASVKILDEYEEDSLYDDPMEEE